MNNIEQTFNEYAATYEERFTLNPLGAYQRTRVHEELVPFLQKCEKILDAGCGPGSDFSLYKTLDLEVEALDISQRMIQSARQRAEQLALKINLHHSSVLDFQTRQKYDAIILNFGVINVFENLEMVCEKLKTMLRPGGTLIIVSMVPFHLFSFLELLSRFKFRAAGRRLFRQRAELENGFRIFYYRKKDFTRFFKLVKKIHLCPLLPTPDQYRRWSWARRIANRLMTIDRKISAHLPDFLGGDHVCYVLKMNIRG